MRFPGCNSGLQCIDQDSVYGMLHVLVRLKSVFLRIYVRRIPDWTIRL